MQPAQLSLLPDQVPAPPPELASQLSPPVAHAAAAIVTRLIIQAAQPGSPAQQGGAAVSDPKVTAAHLRRAAAVYLLSELGREFPQFRGGF